LLEIAELDAQLSASKALRQNPPQAARVKELLTARQALSHELSRRQGARDDLQLEISRVESDVKVVEARRKRDEELLQNVSSPKDAAGLEHELASLARRQGELEDAELELMEKLEQTEASVAEQERLVAETNEEGTRLSNEAKAVVADETARAERLTRDRAALVGTVPPELFALYERLTTRSAGAGLLRARTCGGCHMVLSGTDLQVIRGVPDDVIVNCPECGCILVRTNESGL
jgi:predicted  nucleic acid-binding Zn-ribbon protein